LSLARATLALRSMAVEQASAHLATASAVGSSDPVAQIEIALGLALIASRLEPSIISPVLEPVPRWLVALSNAGGDQDCLRARFVGQVSHALNHAGDVP